MACTIARCSCTTPLALLKPWLEAYQEALCEPLPVFAKCSHGYAHKWRNPGRKEPQDAARAGAAGNVATTKAAINSAASPFRPRVFMSCLRSRAVKTPRRKCW